jgi:hypothetical protein
MSEERREERGEKRMSEERRESQGEGPVDKRENHSSRPSKGLLSRPNCHDPPLVFSFTCLPP